MSSFGENLTGIQQFAAGTAAAKFPNAAEAMAERGQLLLRRNKEKATKSSSDLQASRKQAQTETAAAKRQAHAEFEQESAALEQRLRVAQSKEQAFVDVLAMGAQAQKKALPGTVWVMNDGKVKYTPLLGAVKEGGRRRVREKDRGADAVDSSAAARGGGREKGGERGSATPPEHQ